ncbi:CD209 antigen-like protein E [Penaeus vannamei]|uniref:C-type lectin protein n=1 Tax=Penaeus vannamei TaxID=6689 RepID=A0A423TJ07_PENVA|nr:CD209 antigen-like protein E [Penaeus vannamei]ROT76438.1 C-type lectin protein [Penaeus vannamei]
MKLSWCLALLAALAVPSTGLDVFRNYKSLSRYCPAPFFNVGPECFYVNRAPKSWHQARAACQRMGGDLAEPTHTYVLLEALRDSHDSWEDKWFWTGGEIFNRGGDSSQWTWFSGRPVTEWSENQPQARDGEDCLMMGLDEDPPMYDYFCAEDYHSICELDE